MSLQQSFDSYITNFSAMVKSKQPWWFSAFQIAMGFGVETAIRVGQCLGGNEPQNAKVAVRVNLLVLGMLS